MTSSSAPLSISQKYRKLLQLCPLLYKKEEIQKLRSIFTQSSISRESSENRKDTEKLFDIALILIDELGLNHTSIVSLFLNKALKQGIIELDEIRPQFGDKIWSICKGLQSISHIYSTQQIIDSENFRKLLLSFTEDIRVQLILIASKLYELRHANLLSDKERAHLLQETDFIYIPFSHRLGLYNIKSEMEDLSLRYANPAIYQEISRKLKDSKTAREKYIAEFIAPITAELEKRGIKFECKYRTKTIASILHKMRKNQVEFDEIYDIFAVRFIIDSEGENEKPDCWKVYSVVSDIYTPNPQRLRDWISVPKSNGYESLQTTVLGPGNRWVEVQIRTRRMDFMAEKGFAAHWRYKGGNSDASVEKWLNELREILENKTGNALQLLDDMKIELEDKEVHVFTPKGDLMSLQSGATLLDFAYAIHSNVGNKCMGGKVNNRNETLRYVLKNGDQISIFTSPNQQPKSDWLNIAITSKARNKIRQVLNEEVNKQADLGKEMLQRRFKNWKVEHTDELLRRLMQRYKYKFALDFYQAIAENKIDLAEIKDFILQTNKDESTPSTRRDINVKDEKSISEDVLLIDRNVSNVDYRFAKCCNPVYGDDIMGFVSIGEGIKVHRKECKNAIELSRRYPYRVVNTQWTNEGAAFYSAILKISGKGEGNIITKITEAISKIPKAKIRGINVISEEGAFHGEITILVNNIDLLQQIVVKLKQIKGVERISRNNSMLETND